MQITLMHTNSSSLARDALVLGPNAALNGDPTSTTSVNNTSHKAPQSSVSQHLNLHAWCLGLGYSKNNASLWRWLLEIIAAPQRSSTRTIYKSKWALFEKWCRKFGGFVNSCEANLRLFHIPVPRPKQVPP